MATPPQFEGAYPEDYKDAPEWFQKYLKATQAFFSDTTNALSRGLSSANLRMHEEMLTITIPNPTLPYSGDWDTYPDGRYDSPYPYIYRDASNRVWLTGMVFHPTGATAPEPIITIPEGYRSDKWILLEPLHGNAANIQYRADTHEIELTSGTGLGFLSLHGLTWKTTETRPPFPIYMAPGFQPNHVIASFVHDRSNPTTQDSGSFSVSWDWTSDGRVKIKDIPGLREGKSYSVRLLAL